MRKLLIVLFSLTFSATNVMAENYLVWGTTTGKSGTTNSGASYNCSGLAGGFGVISNDLFSVNTSTGASTLVKSLDTGNCGLTDSGVIFKDGSYVDKNTGNFHALQNDDTYKVYGAIDGSLIETTAAPSLSSFTPSGGSVAILGSSIVGTSKIVDNSGKTIIETKADGSTHIGENSLVTKEVNGSQSLYATDAKGKAIPININNGSSLQVNGVDVMDKINTNTQDIHGSVALSSAMSALPNSSDDAAGTCGMGTGFHKGLSAISAGCAMDFATLTQNSDLSPLFKRASVNLGTSAIMNSKGFSNFALRAGLTFKLGAKKSSGSTLSMDEDLQRYSTGTNTRIADLKKENDVLQNKVMHLEAMQEELNSKLDALIASLNNG